MVGIFCSASLAAGLPFWLYLPELFTCTNSAFFSLLDIWKISFVLSLSCYFICFLYSERCYLALVIFTALFCPSLVSYFCTRLYSLYMLTDVDRWQFFPQLTQDTLEVREHRGLRGSLMLHTVAIELLHAALCKLCPKAKQAFCHLGSRWNWIEIWNLAFVWLSATCCTLSFFSSLKLTLMFGYGYFFYSIWDWFPIISWDYRSTFTMCFWLGIAFCS